MTSFHAKGNLALVSGVSFFQNKPNMDIEATWQSKITKTPAPIIGDNPKAQDMNETVYIITGMIKMPDKCTKKL